MEQRQAYAIGYLGDSHRVVPNNDIIVLSIYSNSRVGHKSAGLEVVRLLCFHKHPYLVCRIMPRIRASVKQHSFGKCVSTVDNMDFIVFQSPNSDSSACLLTVTYIYAKDVYTRTSLLCCTTESCMSSYEVIIAGSSKPSLSTYCNNNNNINN